MAGNYPSESEWRARIARRIADDSLASEDAWREEIKRRMAEHEITLVEIGRAAGISKQRVFQILTVGKHHRHWRLRPEMEQRIREALERILRERYAKLGKALGK